jgi:hypothetical protein
MIYASSHLISGSRSRACMTETAPIEFHLRFEHTVNGLRATAIETPFGELSAPFTPPEFAGLGLSQPSGLTREGSAAYTGNQAAPLAILPNTPGEARQAGQALFEALFKGELLALLRRCQDLARQRRTALRLVLRFGSLPELGELPWEYLFDPQQQVHLALTGEFSIARYIEAPLPGRALPYARPLNVLVFIAAPLDLATLDAQTEWQALQAALASLVEQGQVRLEYLPATTPHSLREALRRQDFHILHYIGHGTFDEQSQEGQLLFEGSDRAARPLSTSQLVTLLGSERSSLGLAVLNACRSAQVAAGLIERLGLPAAVANLAPVADQAAQALAGELYRALADGLSLESALRDARLAVSDTSSAWGLPALFLHTRAGAPGLFVPKEEQMSDDEKKGSRQISIGQGNYFEREIKTQGGDFVLGDKVAGNKVGGNVVKAERGGIAVGGNVTNSTLSTSYTQQAAASPAEFAALLKELRAALATAGLEADVAESVSDDLDKVEKQTASQQPKGSIIQGKLKSIMEVLTAAATGAGAVQTILPLAQKALEWAAQLFH